MSPRVQVILDQEERERFRRQANVENLSLSAWLREAGRDRLVRGRASRRISNLSELHAFFQACDESERDQGPEPDWEDHLKVLTDSVTVADSGT